MKFYVKEIACGGCAHTVRRAIAQVDSVAQVNVDVALKTVEVQSTVSDQMIKDALESAGYSATEAQA
ncbi:heavy-metal-associated domain-containing protein [Caballeronia sp. Lep1P3]|uniref:heavy-metal-associated domain-containing protein n=1 Tax=Caballeronia sp. Lep1P3 TaxID=2878150 RepID=UPI001FCFC4B0|nr:heavy-metal-associated domain-containing protein [Caballeronia sp. Lep1P3]